MLVNVKVLGLSLLICLSLAVGATDNLAYGIPGKTDQVVDREGYALGYKAAWKTARWVMYRLTDDEVVTQVARRSDVFAPDPLIPNGPQLDDYRGSGYDRGHLAPAADMKWSRQAMTECFYLSNMCPQTSELNSGAWNKLEMKCREWAEQEGALYIVCGPIYKSGNHETIGIEHAIRVPDEFFKAVLSLRKGQEKAVAFIFRNDDSSQSYKTAATTVDHVEEITGLDLFHNLDDETEEKVEAEKGFVTK